MNPAAPVEIVRAFAPTGRLRASINTGNPILAAPDAASGAKGVSVDLARGFAERLGVQLELVVFDTAGKSVDAVTQEQADIGFFAIDPKRDYAREKRTLVEFSLEEVEGGTRLTVVESGFDLVPADRRAEAFKMHEGGWEGQLKNIQKYVTR